MAEYLQGTYPKVQIEILQFFIFFKTCSNKYENSSINPFETFNLDQFLFCFCLDVSNQNLVKGCFLQNSFVSSIVSTQVYATIRGFTDIEMVIRQVLCVLAVLFLWGQFHITNVRAKKCLNLEFKYSCNKVQLILTGLGV